MREREAGWAASVGRTVAWPEEVIVHAFRFGVVATPQGGGTAWAEQVRRIADLGFSSVLSPDGVRLVSPLPALAMAAATANIRVGTFVLAAPLRPPASTAWEAHSLSVLTDGRFELGIGAGLPTTREAAQRFGLTYGSGAERLAQVEATIDALRELDGTARHTPVLVAAGGPKALALAGRRADLVTLAAGVLTAEDELDEADVVRAAAGARADTIAFATNIFVVGDDVPPEVARYIGVDAVTMAAHRSVALLRGTVDEMADELRRRRDRLGISYVLVNSAFCERLAPVARFLADS